MQKTGNPITFRDAAKFYSKVQKLERAQGGVRIWHANERLLELSEKLVKKAVPAVFNGHRSNGFFHFQNGAEHIEITARDCHAIAMYISNLSSDTPDLNSRIDNLKAYKNSEEAKFSLKGQTFSSVWKHIEMRSHALFNHQGAIAVEIFAEIKKQVDKLITERTQPR